MQPIVIKHDFISLIFYEFIIKSVFYIVRFKKPSVPGLFWIHHDPDRDRVVIVDGWMDENERIKPLLCLKWYQTKTHRVFAPFIDSPNSLRLN